MINLFKALSAFQKECPVIHKGTQGYGYSYADLPAIFGIINPLLDKHGLGFTQLICGKSVKTILFHIESGEILESITDIPQGVSLAKMNEFQVLGAAITYIRRYALSSILGIITDKDTDAGEEQKAPVKQKVQAENPKEYFLPGSKTDTISVELFDKIVKIDHQNLPLANEILKTIGKESEPVRKYFNNWCFSKAMKYDVATKQYEPIGIALS